MLDYSFMLLVELSADGTKITCNFSTSALKLIGISVSMSEAVMSNPWLGYPAVEGHQEGEYWHQKGLLWV